MNKGGKAAYLTEIFFYLTEILSYFIGITFEYDSSMGKSP